MTSFVRSIGFTMTVAGMLVIGVGAAVPNQLGGSITSMKLDRLASIASLGEHAVAVEMGFSHGSRLCRIPIEIRLWNGSQPGRCA